MPPVSEAKPHTKKKGSEVCEILFRKGLITLDQLSKAVAQQAKTGEHLGEILVSQKVIKATQLQEAQAELLKIDFMDLEETGIDPQAASLISEKMARRYSAIPVKFLDDATILVAMADPSNIFAMDDMKIMTGYTVKPVLAALEDISTQIGKLSKLDSAVQAAKDEFGEEETQHAVVDIREATDDAPIIKLVNSVLSQSVNDGASDLHFEPRDKEMIVRFRIDGVLHEVMRVPRQMQAGVLSRLKVMADLDIAERRVPQDGRIALVVGGKPIDIRVAVLPTVYGEKIVMRLLDKSNVMLDLSDLGFSKKNLTRFEKSFKKPYGAILVTGPTGSGKSTTLYATLNVLNNPSKNIITVEDPVEYRLNGINQVQVNIKSGMTFSRALRSILRCDPDIIMIGEIRDQETAQIAVESALTGHLVLSTLHTNDAPGALSRLNEMGVEPFLTSSAVDGVIAQRLCRRLCSSCKNEYHPSDEMLRSNEFPDGMLNRETTLYRPVGCPKCNNTGYKGRLGIYEIMLVSEAIQRLTIARKSADEISRVAQAEGMQTLRQAGLEKVLAGHTSVEEIERVIV